VVRRWIARELSPAARARALIEEGRTALAAVTRLAERQLSAPPAPQERPESLAPFAGFAAGVILAALAFALAALLR
jgi:ubiquinone biosynthesis protein